MKHRLPRFCAYSLLILAALAFCAILIVSIIIGLNMTSAVVSVIVIFAGFILAAISATILMAVAQILLVFMRVETELVGIAVAMKLKTGD